MLYAYRCEECDQVTERLVMGDKDPDPMAYTPLACKHCGIQGGLRYEMAPPELKFKGIKGRSGFHSVDYPKQNMLGSKTKVSMSSEGRGGRKR